MIPRKRANLVLGVVFLLFLSAVFFKHFFEDGFWIQLYLAITEAAMIGGIADWFAVTALFERPLGFPYHTALIPKNRDKLVLAVADAVQNEFLSTEAILNHLKKVKLVNLLIYWVEKYQGRQLLKESLGKFLQDIINEINPAGAAAFMENFLQRFLSDVKIKPLLETVFKWLSTTNRLDVVLDFLAEEAKLMVAKPETYNAICLYLEEVKAGKNKSFWAQIAIFAAENTNMLNIPDAAKAFQAELIEILVEFHNEDNETRLWLKDNLLNSIHNLSADPEWEQSVENWKNDLFHKVSYQAEVANWFNELLTLKEDGVSPIVNFVVQQAEKYWKLFLAYEDKQDWLEKYLQEAAFHVIEKQHVFIGTIVKDALNGLSDKELNKFVEDKAGKDLAWIRMNGSIVGGIIGLLLFLFLNLVYDPYVLPCIKNFWH